MLRRALTALTIVFAGAAVLFLGFALAGPGAGAQTKGATTSSSTCFVPGCGTTRPTTPSTTAATTTVPPTTAPPTTVAPTTAAPTTQRPTTTLTPRTTLPAPTTTATTLPAIGGNLPVTPSTVPFTTKQQSSHVSPVFAALSGAGLFLALVIVVVRFITTRPPS